MTDRAIETDRDPLFVARAAASFFESVVSMLRVVDREGMRDRLTDDQELRRMLLDQIGGCGAVLARLTVLIEAAATADPELFLDLADRANELQELRDAIAERRVTA